MNTEKKMPVVFSGHGSPLNAIGENRARTGWKEMGRRLGKPRVIIAVSAHWATRGTKVRTAEDNPQINDMYGFPKELYEVNYSPANAPEVAEKVLNLLEGIAQEDNTWGIDHGVWSILSNMYPDADVPVVMVSTDITASPEELYEIGRRLRPLREDGAMMIASGNVVHNLRRVDWSMENGFDWADTFDIRIRDAILSGHPEVAVNYESIPDYRLSIPTVEHYDPLLVALGAVTEDDKAEVWNEYRELGSMSMTSYLWQEK